MLTGDVLSDIRLVQKFTALGEEKAAVIVTTKHKAKGLEWPEIQIADDLQDLAALHAIAKRNGGEKVNCEE